MKKQMISMMLCGAMVFSSFENALYTNYNSDITVRAYSDEKVTEDRIEAIDLGENGAICSFLEDDHGSIDNKFITVSFAAKEEGGWSFSSSNPSVAAVIDDEYWHSEGENVTAFPVKIKKAGKTVITTKMGTASCEVPVIVNEKYVELTSSSSTPEGNITLSWKPVSGVSGYVIYKGQPVNDIKSKNMKVFTTVSGANTSSATISSYWGEKAAYRIGTYIEHNGKKVFCPVNELTVFADSVTTSNQGAQITSVAKSGSSSLKVTWKNISPKASYKLYRSTNENYGYKLIKTFSPASGTTRSYTEKATKGTVYYYRVVTLLNSRTSAPSGSVSGLIPVGGGKLMTAPSSKMKIYVNANDSSYDGFWNKSDDTYYYTQNGLLTIVEKTFENGRYGLQVYSLNKNLKLKSTKTITYSGISSYDFEWGGIYHAYDGNNYVVIGIDNEKEKKNATVVKVIKYSKDWKKLKTLNIKADVFVGVQFPFAGGNLTMDASGNTLYIHTSRTMFMSYDGLNHQSSINFEINTDTMKLNQYSRQSAVSHSFSQFVKVKDNVLYFANHGDGNPRGIKVEATSVGNGLNQHEIYIYKTIFAFNGIMGNNYTGTTVSGMEIGQKNIITVGSSVPHNKAIKSIKGDDFSYNHNVYVIATDRKTGKSTFKWLTKYNPKTSGYTVNDARLVKVTDNRFAVIYNVTTKKTGKKVLHCVYIDGSGNVIKNLTYKTIYFDCASQPIMYNGYITFEGIYHSSTKKKDVTRIIRLPAQV